ncbi:MAG: Maf family protein, partial [Oscillospiraceae bacterium]|nr:Maf family protein [Oscillospiraceae bacterium]
MNVILASQSPRRRELLGKTGLSFTVRVADIDETMNPAAAPFDEVARLSREKALAIPREPEDVVIAADTIVVCNGQTLGKPVDEADAFRMISMLSGRDHQVMTGLTVLKGDKAVTHTEVTDIHFRPLSEADIPVQ